MLSRREGTHQGNPQTQNCGKLETQEASSIPKCRNSATPRLGRWEDKGAWPGWPEEAVFLRPATGLLPSYMVPGRSQGPAPWTGC